MNGRMDGWMGGVGMGWEELTDQTPREVFGLGGGYIRPCGRERKPASMSASAAAMSVGGRSALGSWGGSGSGKRRLFVMGVVGDGVGGSGGGGGNILKEEGEEENC